VKIQNVVHQDVNKDHLVTGVMNTPTITICGVSIAVEKVMRNQKKKQISNNIFKIVEVEK
jgi:glutaredoxin-related protein